MSAPTISACTYGLNHGAHLAGCLESLSWADELVYVDGGSRDDSREIARAKGAKVHERKWTGFKDQLEFIGQVATGDWVLVHDVDERSSPAMADEVRRAVAEARHEGFCLPRKTRYLGRWLLHGEWYPDLTPRLYRRGKGRYVGDPHARLVVDSGMGRLRVPIEHLGYRDLAEQMQKIDLYSTWEAEELERNGVRGEVWKALLHPPARFLKGYAVKAGFLDGWPGLVAAAMTSYHVFSKYAKLWERRHLGGGGGRPA